jgi:hypothetical protein
LYPLLRACVDNGVVLSMHHGRLPQRVAGIAAAAGGQWQIAETHFAAALRLADELPHVIEHADAAVPGHDAARAQCCRGRRPRRCPGGRSGERYRELGMRRHVDLVAEVDLRA